MPRPTTGRPTDAELVKLLTYGIELSRDLSCAENDPDDPASIKVENRRIKWVQKVRAAADALSAPPVEPTPEQVERAGKWRVSTVVDDDGMLGVFISHADGSTVIDVGADIGTDTEFGIRLTTEKIESTYRAASPANQQEK